MEVTGDTLFPWGEYRFTRMKNVPPELLLSLRGKKANLPKPFKIYIRQNIEAIKAAAESGNFKPVELLCKKRLYINEGIAKAALSRITKREQEHKKPIRVYECPVCGGWHLTSIPLNTYLKQENE